MDLRLSARLPRRAAVAPVVARIARDGRTSPGSACWLDLGENPLEAVLRDAVSAETSPYELPPALCYLKAGDILRVNPAGGEARVLYRRGSPHNVLFVTERCNSRCLMCSQPPRDVDDRHLLDGLLRVIPLMDPQATPELCITGGEPMLAGESVFTLVQMVRDHLPRTALHMLSNGRLFRRLGLASGLAAVRHPDLMVGIPLYSDVARHHDFVVQADGAYDETLRGLLNLARVGVRVELRAVIHRQSYRRLGALARFIACNLPFVSQTVFMGLEITGYTRSNLEALWIDPVDYQAELGEAVETLAAAKQRVMVYNHPLCLLPHVLWPFARRSISDWKNVYLPPCQACTRQDECGGFFASATLRHSAYLQPFASAYTNA